MAEASFLLYDSTNASSTLGVRLGNYTEIGETFSPAVNTVLTKAKFWMVRVGTLTGSCYAKLYSITGTPGTNAIPNTLLVTSDAVSAGGINNSVYHWETFSFSGANLYTLQAGTNYAITFQFNASGDASNFLAVKDDSTSPTYTGGNFFWKSSSSYHTEAMASECMVFDLLGTPATSIKTWNGLATASIKTINGLAIASIKSINGLT